VEIISYLSRWFMQFTLNKHKKTFRLPCKKFGMKNTGRIYVLT
jgi:hypothetical protein